MNGLILKSNRCDLHFLVQSMTVFYSTAASETTVVWIPLKLCGISICIQWSAVYHRFVLLFIPFVNVHIQANWLVCPQVHCAELEVIRVWTLHRVYETFASSSSSSSAAVHRGTATIFRIQHIFSELSQYLKHDETWRKFSRIMFTMRNSTGKRSVIMAAAWTDMVRIEQESFQSPPLGRV